ncbi:hypothetical protein ABZ546_13760 [Brachybacterium paraconglomeratum]
MMTDSFTLLLEFLGAHDAPEPESATFTHTDYGHSLHLHYQDTPTDQLGSLAGEEWLENGPSRSYLRTKWEGADVYVHAQAVAA